MDFHDSRMSGIESTPDNLQMDYEDYELMEGAAILYGMSQQACNKHRIDQQCVAGATATQPLAASSNQEVGRSDAKGDYPNVKIPSPSSSFQQETDSDATISEDGTIPDINSEPEDIYTCIDPGCPRCPGGGGHKIIGGDGNMGGSESKRRRSSEGRRKEKRKELKTEQTTAKKATARQEISFLLIPSPTKSLDGHLHRAAKIDSTVQKQVETGQTDDDDDDELTLNRKGDHLQSQLNGRSASSKEQYQSQMKSAPTDGHLEINTIREHGSARQIPECTTTSDMENARTTSNRFAGGFRPDLQNSEYATHMQGEPVAHQTAGATEREDIESRTSGRMQNLAIEEKSSNVQIPPVAVLKHDTTPPPLTKSPNTAALLQTPAKKPKIILHTKYQRQKQQLLPKSGMADYKKWDREVRAELRHDYAELYDMPELEDSDNEVPDESNPSKTRRRIMITPEDDYPVPFYDDMNMPPDKNKYFRVISNKPASKTPTQYWESRKENLMKLEIARMDERRKEIEEKRRQATVLTAPMAQDLASPSPERRILELRSPGKHAKDEVSDPNRSQKRQKVLDGTGLPDDYEF